MSDGNAGKVTCQICSEMVHVIQSHLKEAHPTVTIDDYKGLYPEAPLLSEKAEALLESKRAAARAADRTEAEASKDIRVATSTTSTTDEMKNLHDVFEFGNAVAARNSKGDPISIKVLQPNSRDLVPDIDRGYVFDIDLTKSIIMALEMNIPIYLWGHAGVGKTTALEQVCARTGRGFLRVQHTANTEESDVEGSWRVVNGDMIWADGPLAEAMEHGYIYCADEYDFASPMVASLYQAVLEGKPLRIKAANKLIRPHKNFRIVATGNTNGAGDESGLYAGTQIQNAANYERFGIVRRVEYMSSKQELSIIMSKSNIDLSLAERVVEYANKMREAYENREVAIPMSPRSVLNAVRLGSARSNIWFGLTSSYINRLPLTSAQVAKEVGQRIFGGEA